MVSGSFWVMLTSLDTAVVSGDWLFLSLALLSALVLALALVVLSSEHVLVTSLSLAS